MARHSSLSKNTPSPGPSTVTLAASDLSTNELNGALFCGARHGYNGDRTEIVAPSNPYVIAKLPYTNLAYSTAGQWTAESFASGETTLTDSSATFASYMVGWQIILDMEFPVAQVITAVPSATTLIVAGDVRTLTDPGKFYILFAPPFVNPANGTLADIVTAGEDDDWFDVTGSQYLWAGYRYVPPMVGFNDNGTTKGAQAGNNKLGNYHCNNRVYSIGAGRWLSPDQAAIPFFNLFDYSACAPTNRTDPSGLEEKSWQEQLDWEKDLMSKEKLTELFRAKCGTKDTCCTYDCCMRGARLLAGR